MTNDDVFTLLKADLNLMSPDPARTDQLYHLIQTATQMIAREGVQLKEPYSTEDGQLILMYASYLFRKRHTGEGMPRMLRWALNNRIFGKKEGDGDAAQ